jgi:RNA polymerase sigma-70 factor (ECF subfamily)
MSSATNKDRSKHKMKERFLKTIDAHQSIIHKIMSFYVIDKEDKKDLFQEILLQLWKSFPSFENRSSITTWIYRVALNTALLNQRKRINTKRSLKNYALEYSETIDAQNNEKILSLYMAIDQLSPIDKAITLLYLEQKTYQDIADILELQKSNVGVRVNRIKQKLKTVLTYERKI